MINRENTYIGFILLLGIIILGYSSIEMCNQIHTMPSFLPYPIIDWIIMLTLFVLCRAIPVYISEDKTIDISFVPVVASTMIFGLYPTIILFFSSIFFLFAFDDSSGKYLYLLLRSPKKELFNMANIILSIFIGGQAVLWLGGYGTDFTFPYSILPATVFAIITILVNLLLFILYFVAKGEEKFSPMLSQTILGILPNVMSTIPFGIFIALLLHQKNGSYFVLLFILPLLLARYSFKLYSDSRSMYMRTIASLSRAIEAKDEYTRGHSERVAYFAEEIARAMHLPAKMISEIKVAALLHDIGKIGIEDRILKKAGTLTNNEYEEIKKHPLIGRDIIEDIKLSQTVNDAILYHHCNYDGTGYPKTDTTPEKLPLAAAILGISDAYDAMTSDRPYRSKMSNEKALQIIKENSGTQFDPHVVKAFCEVFEKLNTSDKI